MPRDQAHSYTALESVGDKTHWVSGFLMDLFTVKVTGPCPYDIDDEKDDQFDESDEADAKRREFLKRALVVAEAVSADFVECVRVEQPWLGLHGQRPERAGDPRLDTHRSSIVYAKEILPPTSSDERRYPRDSFLTEAKLAALAVRLDDNRSALPFAEALLADAFYFLWSEPPDFQRSVLTAAIGCEVKIKHALRSKTPPDLVKVVDLLLENPRDWSLAAIALFDKATAAALGSSLKEDDRALYRRVAQLFELRNKIAHKGEMPSPGAARDVVAAAREVFAWVDKL